MKAVILVGGLGTRLRPLTCTTPKPLIPLVNQPFIEYMVSHLRDQGIDEVILAVQYLAERFRETLGDGARLGVKLHIVEEPEPRGTAGAVKHVAHLLDDTTFVFNGDVLTDLDLQAMLAHHRERASKLTIALTQVEDPTNFGLVETDGTGRIRRFIEKPNRDEVTTDLINAGTYLIEPELFEHVPPERYSMFERDLFPLVLQTTSPMYGYRSHAYWTDVGKPSTYLEVHHDILLGKVGYPFRGQQVANRVWLEDGATIHETAQIIGPVVIGPSVRVGPGTTIIGPAVIGARCEIGADVMIEGAVLWEHNMIEQGATLRACIIGQDNCIGAKVHIEAGTVISSGCVIGADNHLAHGIRLWPDTQLQARAISF
jgi:mannose-1-phosphate guanylyltransferase